MKKSVSSPVDVRPFKHYTPAFETIGRRGVSNEDFQKLIEEAQSIIILNENAATEALKQVAKYAEIIKKLHCEIDFLKDRNDSLITQVKDISAKAGIPLPGESELFEYSLNMEHLVIGLIDDKDSKNGPPI